MYKKAKLKKLEQLAKHLPSVLQKMGIAQRLIEQKAVLVWASVVGPEIRKQTVAQRIEKGILYVAVANSVWINELTFLKASIINKLNASIGQEVVKDIKFYLK